MQDVVVLSNWIAALPHLDYHDTEKIFEEYKKERYPVVMADYYVGGMFSKVSGTVSLLSSLCLTQRDLIKTRFLISVICFYLFRA